MVEALVGTERTDGRKSSDRQVPWNLHRIRLRVFCIGYRPDIDSLDILFYRGMCINGRPMSQPFSRSSEA